MIRLQLSARDSISSDMIRTITHGQWSHVDAITADGQLLGARSGAVGTIPAGVQIRPSGYLPFSHLGVVALDASPPEEQTFWNFLMLQIGRPYDDSAYIAGLINRDWRTGSSWCCTELVARALEVSGILRYPLAVTGCIAPTDLILILSTLCKLE